jgi:hypothetical protein
MSGERQSPSLVALLEKVLEFLESHLQAESTMWFVRGSLKRYCRNAGGQFS